ncbi:discs large protein-like protein, partial [Euroglyphus maynei]
THSASAAAALAAAGHHQYSLSENIYGSTTANHGNKMIASQTQQPTSQQYYDENNYSPFASISRSQRLRIPSSSSSTSNSIPPVTKTNNQKVLGITTTPTTFNGSIMMMTNNNTAPIVNPNHHHHPLGLIGDRNSFVSNTGNGPQIEVKWIKCSKDGSPGSPILDPTKAQPDDYRLITIDRSSATLGIRILRTLNDQKGVFVEAVTEGSLAAQAGIRVGDQIIDICGLNMRTADFENAAKVLNQCRDPITMLPELAAAMAADHNASRLRAPIVGRESTDLESNVAVVDDDNRNEFS